MSAPVTPNDVLNQAWRDYYESEGFLTLLLDPKETAGSLASHIEILEVRIKMLEENPEIMEGTFATLIETQTQMLETAQKALLTAQKVIEDLESAVTSELKHLKKFPFPNQVKKLSDLMSKVDKLNTTLWNRLSEGSHKLELLHEPNLQHQKNSFTNQSEFL